MEEDDETYLGERKMQKKLEHDGAIYDDADLGDGRKMQQKEEHDGAIYDDADGRKMQY